MPTPLKFNGYAVGTPDRLTYAKDVHRYFRELERTSPRVKVFSLGMTEENREQILVAISDEANLKNLARLKQVTARLGDPRGLSEGEADRLVAEGKPIYWATGAMHSPETGSPEMLMELGYRLAVDEAPLLQAIRRNLIVLFTPVLEVDGRERMVDVYRYRKDNPNRTAPSLLYWGKYVAHDNNRDGLGLALKQSQHVMQAVLEWHPQVIHDLHESVPFLYTSTGTGPYNAWLDPIVIDEWHLLAYHEIEEMTKRGVPGVWTHGFYDGWAPNYMFYAANGHNAIGRFYETFGNGGADTKERVVRAPERARVVPAQSAAAQGQVVDPQQREPAAVGADAGAQVRGRRQGPLPQELLPEEPAQRREADPGRAGGLRDPGRRAAQRGRRRPAESARGPGRRGASHERRVRFQGEDQGRQGQGDREGDEVPGRLLGDPHGPAL